MCAPVDGYLLSVKWTILIILYHNCHKCFSNVLTWSIAVAALYRAYCNKGSGFIKVSSWLTLHCVCFISLHQLSDFTPWKGLTSLVSHLFFFLFVALSN